ncbi:hypothetical protein L1D52_24160 [Vibrio brasiliensis]|uniref:hypothetical protein n=1 Tax=Vibrio brasiliensis TaxID=170652 RepID=UPI001EFE81AE|nr:hypothetical protein [Vibrio brasiliensis]MCG9785407.1 hypothetical protein [Vibrio brasiliensis]
MYTEQQREMMRDSLMEAFADYTQTTRGAYDNTGVVNTTGYAHLANAMNAQQTRPRGTSKENCSQRIFEHLNLLKALKDLPSHYQKWLKYRYGESNSPQLAQDLIELTLGELDFLSGRPEKKKRLRQLATTWVLSRSQFAQLMQKDIIEALNVNRSTFVKTYRQASESIDGHLERLDGLALDAILDATGERRYRPNVSHS